MTRKDAGCPTSVGCLFIDFQGALGWQRRATVASTGKRADLAETLDEFHWFEILSPDIRVLVQLAPSRIILPFWPEMGDVLECTTAGSTMS